MKYFLHNLLFIVSLAAYTSNGVFKFGPSEVYAAGKSAPINAQAELQKARAEFVKTNYDLSIEAYKKYLRVFPRDYTAWGRLGAAYYHAGQPRKAQKTLQRVERYSPEKSFVYYYQGLCFSLLGMESTAQKYWEYSGWFPDEFGGRATIELAVSTYKAKEDAKAKFLASSYLQRFPQGANRELAQNILKSLETNQRIEEIAVGERPDPDATIFKYNSWSLFKTPHFWLVQLGTTNAVSSGYEPTESKGIESKESEKSAFLVNSSIGIGPIRQKYATAFAGYSYRQRWNIESEGVNAWLGDFFNLELFPLRGDQLERTHQFFGDVRRQFLPQLYAGAYARMEFTRIGSSIFPSPDDDDLKIVLSTTDSQLFLPWIGWSWDETMRTQFYMYFKKEIHNNSPDHSNKSWDLGTSGGEFALSYGLSHVMEFPSIPLSASAELFQNEFIFNDYWLDYTRRGGLIGLDYNIWKNLNTNAILGMYQDNYKIPRLKQGDCGSQGGAPATGSASSATTAAPINYCTRADSGTLIQLGLYWEHSANLRFSGSYQMVENSSGMKEFSENQNTIKVDVTWAFPGVKRVSRIMDRFADAAFTKDSEQ
ncbi:MAG: tetratricopeptide repeat protein [Proteobacteria bacterium]|nr:tetratricopeptide repeat protein [Pseudomonadota bacterium]